MTSGQFSIPWALIKTVLTADVGNVPGLNHSFFEERLVHDQGGQVNKPN